MSLHFKGLASAFELLIPRAINIPHIPGQCDAVSRILGESDIPECVWPETCITHLPK